MEFLVRNLDILYPLLDRHNGAKTFIFWKIIALQFLCIFQFIQYLSQWIQKPRDVTAVAPKFSVFWLYSNHWAYSVYHCRVNNKHFLPPTLNESYSSNFIKIQMQFYNGISPIVSKQRSKVQLVKHNPPFFGHFDKLSWVHFRLCIIILLLTKSVRRSIISASNGMTPEN